MSQGQGFVAALVSLTPRRTRVIIRPSAQGQAGREFDLDDRLHQMLRDLRRALSEAISESSEVSLTLRRIREEGYTLYLLVDCKRDRLDRLDRHDRLDRLDRDRLDREIGDELLPVAAPRRAGEPVFQINGQDLSFLRSIGIDPTRQLRRRRPVPDPSV